MKMNHMIFFQNLVMSTRIVLYPEMLQTENNDNVHPGSLDTTHVEEDDDDIYAGSESPPEFANIEFYGMFLVKFLLLRKIPRS